MSHISHYEKLIQEKRKQTPWREFIKELGSWEIFNIYKRQDTNIISNVKMEYDFLMKHSLPLPTMHGLDRIKIGFR